MALSDSVTGDGILVSLSNNKREVIAGGFKITTIEKEEVREWVALTQSAAEDAADAAVQPVAPAAASYVASEDNRVIGAYKLTKTTTTNTTTIVAV